MVKKKVYLTPFVEVVRVDKFCWYISEIFVVSCVHCAVAQLRHCAKRWEVEGSIHDCVIGIFNLHNPSGRTTALGVDSASKRNGYEEYFLVVKGGQCVGLTTLLPS
jgi:hypothetical protein